MPRQLWFVRWRIRSRAKRVSERAGTSQEELGTSGSFDAWSLVCERARSAFLIVVNIRLTSNAKAIRRSTSIAGSHPSRLQSRSCVWSSPSDPCAMAMNWAFSLRDSLVQPSAMLLGIDTAARFNWDRMPYRSSGGNRLESRQTCSASNIAFSQTTAFR